MMKEAYALGGSFEISKLQDMQDNFAKAMGLAFVTVDFKGRPITKPSGFTDFCTKGRENVAFEELCFQCDAHGGLHSAITGQPYVYRCHADLVDFAVPLIVNGSYVGAVLGGQIKLSPEETEQLEFLIPRQTSWKRDPELLAYHEAVRRMDYSQVEASVTLMRDVIQFMLENGHESLGDLPPGPGPAREVDHRADEEPGGGHTSVRNSSEFDVVFRALNVAARLAYQEKAERSESALYDVSDMMRYLLSNSNSHIVMLEEEINYIERLLRMQQADLKGGLRFSIDVQEEYQKVACPYLLLQPLVEHAVQNASKGSGEAVVSIRSELVGKTLNLVIFNSGPALTPEEIEALTETREYYEGGQGRLNLYAINWKLKAYFGRRYGLEVRNLRGEDGGVEVCVQLPSNLIK